MKDVPALAQDLILSDSDIDISDLEATLASMMVNTIDYAEVYLQSVRSEAWGLEDGIVKDGSFAVDAGMGLRALSGEKTGFAYVEGMARDGLKTAAKAARSIAKQGAAGRSPVGQFAAARPLYPPVNPISMLDEMAKVHLLQRIDQVARQTDPRVKEVTVRVSANHDVMLVMASDGTAAADVRPLVRLDVSVIVESNGRRERG
ncbi:metalloprotease TldD, partial [bacterium]|nr:metalloprotease TldD [bacterium]